VKETPELPPSQRGENPELDTPRLRRWLRPSAWPYRLSYPLLGSLLALGSPAGFLLLRAILGHLDLSAPALREEIASQPLTYGYLLGSSLLAFGLLGWGLGRKEDALKAASATDPLTGCLNRRACLERLGRAVSAVAGGEQMVLCLIDLDGFKAVNDGAGHAAGDAVLRNVATRLGAAVRETDTVARLGGDVSALVDTIEREKVGTIFAQASVNPKVERAIARETGAAVGEPLWADALGPADSSGATYLGSIAANTRALANGFGASAGTCDL